jgi:hypothetical protein
MSSTISSEITVPDARKDSVMSSNTTDGRDGSREKQQIARPKPKFNRPIEPAPVELAGINAKLIKKPPISIPLFAEKLPARAICATSFVPFHHDILMRQYQRAYIDFVDLKKGFGFASYTDRSGGVANRVQLFFHLEEYRPPETLASSLAKRPHVVQISTVKPEPEDMYVPAVKRDRNDGREAIYYVLGENSRGPCITSWTTVLEYNEFLDKMVRMCNEVTKAALELPVYSLYISKPKSAGMHCDNATKTYTEKITWEESLAWVGNNLHCEGLVDVYMRGLSTNPRSQFRWQQHDMTYAPDTGEWKSVSARDCVPPVEEAEPAAAA